VTTADAAFQVPRIEWVAERLLGLQKLLEQETARSALLLQRVLGPMRLCLASRRSAEPNYRAETVTQVLEVLG
jgi:hypothetical protein